MSPRPARRRRRPTRVLLASLLVAGLTVLTVVAVSGGSTALVRLSAVAGTVVAVLAARLVYLELLDARRLAAAERASQAVAHRAASRARRIEHAQRLRAADALAGRRGEQVARLEADLEEAVAATVRAEAASALLAGRVAQAEERAAHAQVRLGEAELERDALEDRRRTGRVVPGRRTA